MEFHLRTLSALELNYKVLQTPIDLVTDHQNLQYCSPIKPSDINKHIGPTDTLWSQIFWMVGCPTERGIATLPVLINLHSYSLLSNWHCPFKLPPYQSQPTPSVSSQVRPSVKSFLTLASETSESSLHLLPAPPLVPLPDSFHLFHLFQLPHLQDPFQKPVPLVSSENSTTSPKY